MAAVLLVEDVGIVRAILRKFLESAGHRVTECESGGEAARRVETETFDVVVTDLWMKNGDGLEFIAAQARANSVLRIVAMTGGDPRASGARSLSLAQEAGATKTLAKPVTKATLLAAIDCALESGEPHSAASEPTDAAPSSHSATTLSVRRA